MNWRLWTWKDIASVAAVTLVVGAIIYAAVFIPRSKTNYGFGPEWDCQPRPSGAAEPICVKKRVPN
jgi:hypothetical protein